MRRTPAYLKTVCGRNDFSTSITSKCQTTSSSNEQTSRVDLTGIVKSYFDKTKQTDDKMKVLMAPYNYTISMPHANLLYGYIDGMNHWIKVSSDKLDLLKMVCTYYYDSILMHDDITDSSALRRNVPTAYTVYGKNRVLQTVGALRALINKKLADSNNLQALHTINSHLLEYYNGFYADLTNRRNKKCLTKEQTIVNYIRTTSICYMMVAQLMQCYSTCQQDFRMLTNLFGLYVKLLCDHACFTAENKSGKYLAEDINSGISSLPVVLAVEPNTVSGDTVLDIIRNDRKDEDMSRYCFQLIKQLGSIEKLERIINTTYDLVIAEVNKLGGNPDFVEVVDRLKKWNVDEIYDVHPDYNDKEQFVRINV